MDGEVARLEVGGTRNLEAWEAFLQGVLALLKYSKADNLDARRLFEQALSHDQDYLDAKIYYAWTHWIDARQGFVTDRAEAIERSHILLEEIKTVGAESANAKHLEAVLFLLEGRHDEALEAAAAAALLGPCKLFGNAPAALTSARNQRPATR